MSPPASEPVVLRVEPHPDAERLGRPILGTRFVLSQGSRLVAVIVNRQYLTYEDAAEFVLDTVRLLELRLGVEL